MRAARQRAGRSPQHQRGMAVIVAMLVVAIVAVIAAGLILRQSTALRTLRGEQLRVQVGVAVDAALERASLQLREDAAQRVNTLVDGTWSRPIVIQAPLPVEMQLHDAQAAFNFASLVRDGQPDHHAQRVLQRICEESGIGPAPCLHLRQFVMTRMMSGQAMPRDADALLAIALPEIDADHRQALAGHCVVLPLPTLVNANTSTLALLSAELPDSPLEQVRSVLAERDSGRYFLNAGDIAFRLRMTQAQAAETQLGVHSEWFLAEGRVQADAVSVPFQALIWREHRDLGVRVQRMWTRIGT